MQNNYIIDGCYFWNKNSYYQINLKLDNPDLIVLKAWKREKKRDLTELYFIDSYTCERHFHKKTWIPFLLVNVHCEFMSLTLAWIDNSLNINSRKTFRFAFGFRIHSIKPNFYSTYRHLTTSWWCCWNPEPRSEPIGTAHSDRACPQCWRHFLSWSGS